MKEAYPNQTKMKKLSDLFVVSYGNKFDLNKMTRIDRADGGVNFVGRSSKNHGVSGTVQTIENTAPYGAGLITTALGGSKLLCSFVQEHPFYTAQNVAVLSPIKSMSFSEKLFYCLAIRHNRFRYSAFGREANRTLRQLLVPDISDFPEWVKCAQSDNVEARSAAKNLSTAPSLSVGDWTPFTLSELFDLKKGRRLTKANMVHGTTPFIGAIDGNNGLKGFVGQPPMHPGNVITVTYNGSVAEAFYQPFDFRCSDDVHILYPKFKMNEAIALFICTVIRREKYRFSYGRKWHLERMTKSVIKLPADSDGGPDWRFMQSLVDSLPYSSQLY